MEKRSGRSKALLAAAGLAVIFLLGMGAERIIDRAERWGSDSLVPDARAQDALAGADIPAIVERAVPAIVNIQNKRVTRVSQQVPPIFQDPFFRRFFGDQIPQSAPRERIERSLGSGIIVSDDGYILTNNHVIANATELIVNLPDNREFNARVVGTDTRTEVAVIKIDAKDLPYVRLGDSAKLRLGETVLAIGYPFGVGQSVTQGIVSALGRNVAENRGVFVDFIQTDAAINPGNSGGALINARGELVGINTMIYSNTGSYAGLGFAIPVNLAREVMDQIMEHGRVVRGYLGVDMDNLTADKAEFYGFDKGEGAIITTVVPDSPAEKAGLRVDDVVTAVNGTPVKGENDLRTIVSAIQPGGKAAIELVRDGKPMKLTATVAARPEEPTGESAQEEPGEKATPELELLNGLGLEELNRYYRSELQIPPDVQGILVTEVDPNSPGGDVGLRGGDVILRVNKKPTRNIREFNAVIKGVRGERLLLTIYRQGSVENVVLKP